MNAGSPESEKPRAGKATGDITNQPKSNTPAPVAQDRVSNARARLATASTTDFNRLAEATGCTFQDHKAASLRQVSKMLGVCRAEAARVVIAACGIWGRHWRDAQ